MAAYSDLLPEDSALRFHVVAILFLRSRYGTGMHIEISPEIVGKLTLRELGFYTAILIHAEQTGEFPANADALARTFGREQWLAPHRFLHYTQVMREKGGAA